MAPSPFLNPEVCVLPRPRGSRASAPMVVIGALGRLAPNDFV
jgi:hypothetical protein